jgi:hypothetical protein
MASMPTVMDLNQAKARGVKDMGFHKKAGLRIEDMVKSRWVYRKWARPLQSLCLVLGRRLQPHPPRPPQTNLISSPSTAMQLSSTASPIGPSCPLPATIRLSVTRQISMRYTKSPAGSSSQHDSIQENNSSLTDASLASNVS